MFKLADGNTTNGTDEIVTNSICTQSTVMAPMNYHVTYSANKNIYWCGDCN